MLMCLGVLVHTKEIFGATDLNPGYLPPPPPPPPPAPRLLAGDINTVMHPTFTMICIQTPATHM